MTVVWTALLAALALILSVALGLLSLALDDSPPSLFRLAQLAALCSITLALLSLRERT